MRANLPQWVFSCPNATRGTREDELCPSPDLFSQRYWRGGLLFRSGTSVFTALPPGLRASESVCCAVVGCFHGGSGAAGPVFTAIPRFHSATILRKRYNALGFSFRVQRCGGGLAAHGS